MSIELPSELTEPLGWIGLIWPQADEDKLFAAGRTWFAYGTALRGHAGEANAAAQRVAGDNEGAALDAFVSWWNAGDGPGPNLGDNATAAELIGAGLMVMGTITLALKLLFIAQLIALAAEVAQAIATAFVSFGATTAEIPGFVALCRVVLNEAIEKVVGLVEREIAELFEKAAALLEKVGAKDLAGGAERLSAKALESSQGHLFADLMSKAERLDVSSPHDGATFYSGFDKATGQRMRTFAERDTDGITTTTLERTPGGRQIDDMHLYDDGSPITKGQADQVWAKLSERYAAGARGRVTAYLHNADPERVYLHDELPKLLENDKVTSIRHIDPTLPNEPPTYVKGGP